MDAINRITIDVSDPLNTQVVHAVQEDIRSRFVEITLVRNGEPLDIPVGAVGVVGLRRPNETYVLYDTDEDGNAAVTFDGNVATCYLRQEALAMAGSMYTSVSIYSSDHTVRLTAFHFMTDVDATAVPSDVIVEHDYINIFQAELDEINTLLGDLSATATTLPAGSDATASYSDGVFSFGIPQGETGGVSEEEFEAGMASKANVIIDSASGDIVSIPDGAGGMNARSLVVSMSPIQDLHGYGYPWPAGGGKNLIDYETVWSAYLSGDEVVNPLGSVHYTFPNELVNQQVTVSAMVKSNANNGNCRIRAYINGTAKDGNLINNTSDFELCKVTVTPTSTSDYIQFTSSGSNGIYKNVQLELGSTATSYAPYSNVCQISGLTGLTVTRTGTNLRDVETISDVGWAYQSTPVKNVLNSLNIGTYTLSFDFTITSVRDVYTSDTAKAIAGRFYGFVGNSTAVRQDGVEITRSQALSGYSGKSVATFDITAENKGKFTSAYFYGLGRDIATEGAPNGALGYADITNIQIEVGSTASPYTPYTGQTYPVSWQSEAGTVYSGTVDVVSGLLTVDMVAVDMGSLNWVKGTGTIFSCSSDLGYYRNFTQITVPNFISSIYVTENWAVINTGTQSDFSLHALVYDGGQQIRVYDSRYSDVATFLTGVSGQTIAFELATPQTYQLTPTEVEMLLGVNNIFSDGGSVSLTYPCDTKLFIEKLTKPTEDDMVANANIPIHKFFMIGNSLYYSTLAIASGESIIVGTNCSSVSLADALNQISA